MSDRKSLDAAKQLVRKGAARQAPSAEAFVPEIRSNIKWKPSTSTVDPLRPEASVLVVWNFGVPFHEIDGFHRWLETNEVSLEAECRKETANAVHYLGTYMHLETGAPRYHTQWGLRDDDENGAAAALEAAFASNQQLKDLTTVLRGYWARDPGATDHRFGLARNYINLDGLPSGGAFWTVTLDARTAKPA